MARISQKLKANVLENKFDSFFFLSMLSSFAVFPFRKIHLGYSIYNLTEILIHVPCFINEKEIRVAVMKGTRLTKSPKP
jgi:hypothetical protein